MLDHNTLTNCKGNDVKDIVSGTWEIENNSPDVEITSSKMNVSSITVKAKASGKTNVNVNIKCLYTKDNGTQGTNTFKITVNESGKWSYAYYLCQEYMSNDNHGGLLYDDPLSYGFQSRITSITVTDDNGISWTFNWSTESNGEWRMTGSNVSEKTAKKQPVFSAGTVYTGTCGGDTYKFTLTKVDGWSYIDGAQKKVNLCYYLRFITDYTVNVYLESPSGTLFDGKYFTLDAPPRAGSFTFYYPVGSIDDSEYEDTGLYSEPTQLLAQNYVTALLPGYQLYKATNSVGATVPGITVSLFGGNVLNVYCTLYNYTVEYKWADGTDSDVIAAATLPTDSGSYTVLSAPTASTTAIADVSADGGTYSFNGWGTAVQDDVNHKYVFTGSWTYTASPKYTLTTIYTTNGVEDGRTTQTDLATVPLSPPLGSPATYGGKDYVFSGMTNTGNDYTLTYVRYTYTVAYSWTGAPAGQTIPSDSTEYASETAAQTAVDISFTSSTEVFSTTGKYQFSGWTENTGDGSSYVVSFTGSWTYTAATEDITGTSTSFTVKKQDASGTPLKGATFTLKNSSDVEVIKSSTDSSGNYTDILFDGLTAGTYTLTESAPTGYDGAGPWTVTVATDGSTYVSGPDSNNIIHKVWNWLVSAVSGTSSTNLLSGGVLTVTNSLKTYDVNYQFVTTGVAGAVAAPSGVSVPTKDTGVTHGTTAYAIKDYTGTPSDAGYTFHGWYTNAACTTAAVDPGTNATISGATTYYGYWTRAAATVVNHYYIVYNSGEGTGSDVIDNNSGSYYSTAPSAIAFPSSFTAPSHKSFSGWSPASVSFASATEDASKQTYTNATNTTDKYYYVTLTAQYVSDTGSLKITKVLNSDAPSSAASKVYSFTVTGPNGYDNTVTITGAGSKTIGSLLTGEYKVTEKNAGIGGYVLNIAYSTTDGKATVTKDGTADVTVTNSYSAIAVPLATYTLTVNWLDDEGNSLRAQEVTKNITSGSDYAAVQHAFEGYTFSKMATGSDAASGKMTGDKTVTFIYTKTAPTNPEGDITDPENPTPSPGVPANPEGDITIVDDDVPTSDSPQTGDSNNPFLLLAIMAGCVLGIVGIAVGNRKKRSNG